MYHREYGDEIRYELFDMYISNIHFDFQQRFLQMLTLCDKAA